LSYLAQCIKAIIATPTSGKRRPKVTFTFRVDTQLKNEAQSLFGRDLGKVLEAALADAIAIAKEGAKPATKS
jgi:hypothetical protein